MVLLDPVLYYLSLYHGIEFNWVEEMFYLQVVSRDCDLEFTSGREQTLHPHGVYIDPLLYLGRCIHSVKVITLYETTKLITNYL
jgi:hypothetical protein